MKKANKKLSEFSKEKMKSINGGKINWGSVGGSCAAGALLGGALGGAGGAIGFCAFEATASIWSQW